MKIRSILDRNTRSTAPRWLESFFVANLWLIFFSLWNAQFCVNQTSVQYFTEILCFQKHSAAFGLFCWMHVCAGIGMGDWIGIRGNATLTCNTGRRMKAKSINLKALISSRCVSVFSELHSLQFGHFCLGIDPVFNSATSKRAWSSRCTVPARAQ